MGTTASKLGEALFGKTRQAVLSLFFLHPDQSFYLREVVRRTGGGVGAVQREIRALVTAGILNRSHEPRPGYAVNQRSPIYPELLGIVLKTVGLGDVLHDALAKLKGRVRTAFVYGSFARGEHGQASDVDVMIVGDASFAEVVAALRPAARRLGREVNPTLYGLTEFRRKLAEKNHFLTTVIRDPKIFLIGSDDDLAAMAGERLAG